MYYRLRVNPCCHRDRVWRLASAVVSASHCPYLYDITELPYWFEELAIYFFSSLSEKNVIITFHITVYHYFIENKHLQTFLCLILFNYQFYQNDIHV